MLQLLAEKDPNTVALVRARKPVELPFHREVYAGHDGDARSCVPRAIATAACLPYEKVAALCAKHGRKPNRGTPGATSYAVIVHELGGETVSLFRQHPTRSSKDGYPTLKRFIEEHPKGHYVVMTRNHSMAVIDGVVHDWSPSPRVKIERAFRLDINKATAERNIL